MRRRWWALVAVAVVVVLVGSWAGYRYAHRQVPVVVDPACPPVLTHSSDATDDYGDVVQWDGRTWWRSQRQGRTRADLQVGSVTCSLGSLDTRGRRVVQTGWPDGTATVLPKGTTLHVPREDRADEALVAHTAEGDVLYCLDEREGPPTC